MLYERADIYLSQHKPQGIRFGIANHHELVSSRGLEKMEFVGTRSVIDKLVIPSNLQYDSQSGRKNIRTAQKAS